MGILSVVRCVPRTFPSARGKAQILLPKEVPVHSSTVLGPEVPSQAAGPIPSPESQSKPHLKSLDCGQECCLAHLLELYKLLDREDPELKGYVFDDECLGISG
jgi:hypothetical protein